MSDTAAGVPLPRGGLDRGFVLGVDSVERDR